LDDFALANGAVQKMNRDTTEEKTIRVLIVDDEKRFLSTTSSSLRKRGYDVDIAENGSAAVLKVWSDDYDVVILDIKMPGRDGHRTLREIKGLKPGIEVIMLTGHGSLESALEGWHDEVFTYLTKPCDIDTLAGMIDCAYETRGQEKAMGETRREPIRDEGGKDLGEKTSSNRHRGLGKEIRSWVRRKKSVC
jgi:DNA-binding NtrC family response regulator